MTTDLQRVEVDKFHYVFTKSLLRNEFAKELEQIYDKHYKPNYEQDGFRKGEVPFQLAILNAKLSSSLLKTVAIIDRQIFVEEIIKETSDIGSIYDIVDGEAQTNFEAFDLSSEQPVVFQLTVELASYVESVNYKEVKVDRDIIKSKQPTEKDFQEMFKEYKKVKEAQNKATKTSYVQIAFSDGKDEDELTFNLGQKFTEEDDALKVQTHKEVTELVMGKSVGDEFKYSIMGKDGSKLDVTAKVKDVYRIKTLSDDEFVEMVKENTTNKEKDSLDIDKVKVVFRDHLDSVYNDNFQNEVRSLTFASLNKLTTGIHYNENELNNLKNQFVVQVQKVASEEGTPYEEYIIKNFGTRKLMEDYVDASQRARVLQAAMYRKIGKDMNLKPTYMQLEAFVKVFLFKINPNEKVDDAMATQINEQVTTVLAEPLNRQRVIESWASVKAEDTVTELVGLLK